MKRRAGWVIPVLLAVLVGGGWTSFWLRPRRAEVAQLAQAVAQLRMRQAELTAEIARARATDLSVRLQPLEAVREQWKAVVAALEAERFKVNRVEISVTTPQQPAQQGGAPQGEAAPGAATPGVPAASGLEIVQVLLQLQLSGSYADLAQALSRVRASVPSVAWSRLELEGEGDGNLRVTAQLTMLARKGGAP